MENINSVIKSLKRDEDTIEKIDLTVSTSMRSGNKHTFDSALSFYSFIKRDENKNLYNGEFEVVINRGFENSPFREKVIKTYYEIVVFPVRETKNVPYYQFCKGDVCNINGDAFAPEIKNVIFNPPATIVFWADGTKTVVKCDSEDVFDPEKGLAMAISKKMLCNKYEYYNIFKKWMKKWDKEQEIKKDLVPFSYLDAYNELNTVETKAARIKMLTNYDLDDIIDILENGGCVLPGPNRLNTDLTDVSKNHIYCKDCVNFTPAGKMTKDLMMDLGDSDGVCCLDTLPVCVDAFDSCGYANEKIVNTLKTEEVDCKC